MSEVKKSLNKVQINGTLNEMNLMVEEKDAKLTRVIDGNKIEKTVKCRVISKKDFKNPSFTVMVNGAVVEVEYFGVKFGVAEKALDENGDVIENKNFKSLETIMNNYVSMVDLPKYKEQLRREGKTENEIANATATRVKVDGSLGLNEYASTTRNADGEFFTKAEITAFGITSANVSEEDSADAEISGVIKTMNREVKNDEETGRLIVEFISFGYNGVAEPFKFIVESDLANAVESNYELGTSTKLSYEIINKTVGTKKVSSGGFGRRDAKIQSGYTVTEYSIFRGDDPFEEENEYFVDVQTVREKLEEREIMIANKIKEAVEKANNIEPKTFSPKGASSRANSVASPFGTKSSSGATTKKVNPFG